MTSDLNLWAAPREKGKPLDVLDAGDAGRASPAWSSSGFAQILLDGQVRWVNDDVPLRQEAGRDPAAAGAAASGTAGASRRPASPSRPARTAPAPSPG